MLLHLTVTGRYRYGLTELYGNEIFIKHCSSTPLITAD